MYKRYGIEAAPYDMFMKKRLTPQPVMAQEPECFQLKMF